MKHVLDESAREKYGVVRADHRRKRARETRARRLRNQDYRSFRAQLHRKIRP